MLFFYKIINQLNLKIMKPMLLNADIFFRKYYATFENRNNLSKLTKSNYNSFLKVCDKKNFVNIKFNKKATLKLILFNGKIFYSDVLNSYLKLIKSEKYTIQYTENCILINDNLGKYQISDLIEIV